MEEESAITPINVDPPAPRQRFRPYTSVFNLSRRLGHAATMPLAHARDILQKEVTIPNTQQLIGTSDPFGRNKKSQEDNHAQDSKKLRNLVERSHEVLARATTVFPFTPFPDTIIVDRTKVTIIKRNFFWSEDVVSIRIEDVLNATLSMDMMFGSLSIASRVMNSTDHYQIKFFWKQDALHLKHVIQGYVIAQHNNIQVSHLSKEELIQTLLELGHDSRR